MTYSLALEVTLDFYRIGSKLLEEHANVCSLCLFRQAQKLMDKRQRQKKDLWEYFSHYSPVHTTLSCGDIGVAWQTY